MFFDARAAKALGPGEHLVVDGCPGLRLVASATRRTWTYRYKAADGRMRQLKLGEWPDMPIQAAASAWDAQRRLRAGGADPALAKRAEKAAQRAPVHKPYLVRALVADYIAGHLKQARAEEGAAAAERALLRFLDEAPTLADKAAAEITRADAFTALDARKDKPTATAKLRSMMGAAWDYALDAGKLDGNVPNWWRAVMRGRLKSKGKILGGKHVGRQRRVLQPPELATLLAWLPNMHPLGRDTLQMYLWTCTRGVEILAMRPENVFEEGDGWWWTIPKEQTKNARYDDALDLRVPLEGRALEIVQRRLDAVGPSGWLFEDARGEQYTQHDFSTYIYGLQPYSEKVERRARAGLTLPVTHWTPHNLRRTSRTLLSSLGCSKEIAEAMLGHKPPEVEETYNAYSYDKERRRWLRKLSVYLESLAAAG